MILRYAGKSAITAQAIADQDDDIMTVREGKGGDVNWGRERANTILNPDISNSTNKRVMRELFAKSKVPMPKLYTPEAAQSWYESDATPVLVGRPDQHMQGRGFWLVNNKEELAKALKGTKKKQAATHFMEYIDADKEMRVHIFNGKSIRMTEKKFEAFDGYHHEYTTIKPTGDKREKKLIRRAAKKAVKALGLDFGAVDILVKDGKPFVLEVNAAPGLGGTMPKLYASTIKKWYDEHA